MERLIIEVVEGWQEMEGNEKVVWVVGKVCENGGVRKAIENMWRIPERTDGSRVHLTII